MPKHNPTVVSDDLLMQLKLCKIELPVQDVPANGREWRYQADEPELHELSNIIGLGKLGSLEIIYEVSHFRKNSFKMTSDIKLEIEQSCVITLNPVTSKLHDIAATRFVPQHIFEEITNSDEDDILEDDNLEPIADSRLNIGRILYEQITGAINPYPRAPGVEFDPASGADPNDDGADLGPFAGLAKLKKSDSN